MTNFTLQDFDYDLPQSLIAQFPVPNRSDSRLLVVPSHSCASCIHTSFSSILHYVQPNDLLIFNNTKVMNARLFGCKESGGKISCLIERIVDDQTALAHIGSSHPPKVGGVIKFEDEQKAVVIARENNLFVLQFEGKTTISAFLQTQGHLPLPPYITREVKREDWDRYQTVYAKQLGAVAAPTAGLHFDEAILSALKNKNIEMGFLTLHIGAGTFQPVRTNNLSDHVMHAEIMSVPQIVCDQIKSCRQRGGRVIAVGTTVVRALESAAISGEIKPFYGETSIFITPGFQFNIVDRLLTNFHLPKSTLLMLVSAFAGFDRIKSAYQEAVREQYRFFSYGDAMLLIR